MKYVSYEERALIKMIKKQLGENTDGRNNNVKDYMGRCR